MSFNIKIADVIIEINNKCNHIFSLCKDYYADNTSVPDFSVEVSKEEFEKEKSLCKDPFPDGVIEATCIHRQIAYNMVRYGVFIIHSAVVAVDGQGYAFLAKSGVGKSTHIRQWKKRFGDKAIIVNGDKPMYAFRDDRLFVFGTPWKGKEGWGENVSMPIKAFYFLERGEKNEIRKIDKSEIISRLFHQMLVPKNSADLDIFMKAVDKIINTIPFCIMKCNISEEAAQTAFEYINR